MPRRQLEGLWLKALLFALFGYALFGKGFAYFFVGEVVLLVGIFIFLLYQRFMLIFSDSVLFLWAAFAFWGLCRTVPFLSKYRFDAVRDAVFWGYGVFALLIVAFVNHSDQISRGLNTYRKFLRWYLPVVPGLILISAAFRTSLPRIPWAPGGDVTVIMLKAGDAAVHLAAAGLFLLIFPDKQYGTERQGLSVLRTLGFIGWSISAVFVLVLSRGGLAAMVIPITIVSLLKSKKIGWKVAGFAVVGIMVGVLALEVNPFTIRVKGETITPTQITSMVGSMVGSGDAARGHEGTKAWRLIWWGNIMHDTLFGPRFWTGRGFGVNLAVEYGPPGLSLESITLRSPHNGSMTVLARMGVPGLLLWAAMNLTFAFRLLRAYWLASRSGATFWGNVDLWIFCYWLAAFINMSFDVYLEGPPGGIWFWSIIGFGVAALRVQKYEARKLRVEAETKTAYDAEPQYALAHS
jgi:hypothetical protein